MGVDGDGNDDQQQPQQLDGDQQQQRVEDISGAAWPKKKTLASTGQVQGEDRERDKVGSGVGVVTTASLIPLEVEAWHPSCHLGFPPPGLPAVREGSPCLGQSQQSIRWCHQKYFTLQFRPSPSEIVVMTCRSSPLTIQCIIPNFRWKIHKLTSSILCRFNFLMLGCYLIFICLQRPPGRLGYTSPQ